MAITLLVLALTEWQECGPWKEIRLFVSWQVECYVQYENTLDENLNTEGSFQTAIKLAINVVIDIIPP